MKGEIIYMFRDFSGNIFDLRPLKEIERFYYLSKFVKEIKNKEYQSILISRINFNLIISKINLDSAEHKTLTEKEAISNGFKEASLSLMDNNNYNYKIIFNSRSNEFLNKIFEDWNNN